MPRIARSTNFMTGVFLIALAALVYVEAAALPMGSAVRMGAGYVPRLLSFLLAGFGVAIIGIAFFGEDEQIEGWSLRPLACVLLVPVVFALTIDRLGLIVAVIACTMLAALGSRESRSVEAMLLSIALAAFTLALFVWSLGIPMRPLPNW